MSKVTAESGRLGLTAALEHPRGHEDAARAALAALKQHEGATDPYSIAVEHAWRREADLAFEWLEKAFDLHQGGLSEVKVDPWFKALHADARYTALLKKMNLPAD